MEIKLAERREWLGKVTVVPAFAGTFKGKDVAYGALHGLEVGDEEGETTVVRAGERRAVLISMGERKGGGSDVFRRGGGRAAKWLVQHKVGDGGVDAGSLASAEAKHALAALCEGVVLGGFQFDQHKSEKQRAAAADVAILLKRATKSATAQAARAGLVGQAANLAREIAHQPPNVIQPASLAARAKKLCAQTGLTCKVLDEKQMKRLGMGGILAVGQGSDNPPRLIVIEYRGRSTGSGGGKPIVLVGKAITFDTGGYSIKSTSSITGMKYDKCGGTAVLGAMQAVAALKPRVPVIGIVAAAENMISGGAYRPDDIITTMSGKTVEIVSADAEGRLVLCDALTYAQKHYKPRAIIDLATLTGGVVVALGNNRAGLFCDDDRLRAALIDSADRTHERLWPLPLDDEYLEAIKGTDSDLKNSGGRSGHAIVGAVFLKQFVEPDIRWAHLDIAGVADVDKDQPYCPKGATGFGVRLLADYLERLRG